MSKTKTTSNMLNYQNMVNFPLRLPDPERVLSCIDNWRALDLKQLSDSDIDSELTSFLQSLGSQLTVTTPPFVQIGGPWRIRRFDYLIKDESECWEPPTEITKMGRCNAKNDPVLYISPEITTPFEELSIGINTPLYIIEYVTAKPLQLFDIALSREIPLNKEGNPIFDAESIISYQIIREFIRCEFLKPVGKGTEYLHRISSSMCRVWFNNNEVDGWRYPSVHLPTELNFAIKAKSAHNKLRVEYIHIAKLVNKEKRHIDNINDQNGKEIIDSKTIVLESDFKGEINSGEITWRPSNEVLAGFN